MTNDNTNTGVNMSKTKIGLYGGLIAAVSAATAWWFTARHYKARASELAEVNRAAIEELSARIDELGARAPRVKKATKKATKKAAARVAAALKG
jgi:hypothetical protein